ncbi:unnamed protein product [Candida verbasci]|uniref:Uncharacterized protein n=1 Tax=Candida verbasci TaxID=1227364 RepID=A0A9W4TTF9_9ASCO|nr:unnamed protein product [Candida verbasci]
MNTILSKLFILIILYYIYKLTMSSSSNPQDNKVDIESFKNLNPDQIMVDVNGKKVPLSRINKPHAVIHPQDHQPQQQNKDASNFPKVESDAKNREDIKEFNQHVLKPDSNKPKVDASSFPKADDDDDLKERAKELNE